MNTPSPDCPFCLGNNLLAVPILAETEGAFLVPAQSFPGNYLIVPRTHAEFVADLPDSWMRDFKQLLAQVPELDQYNISLNIGKLAGQTLKHLHFWIIPRADDQPASGKGLLSLIKRMNAE